MVYFNDYSATYNWIFGLYYAEKECRKLQEKYDAISRKITKAIEEENWNNFQMMIEQSGDLMDKISAINRKWLNKIKECDNACRIIRKY